MANLRVNKITSTETFETTGSVQFDGTTDFLSLSSNTDFAMGTGDFTVECWVYVVSDAHAEGAYGQRVFDSNTGQLGIYINSDGTGGYVGALVSGTDIRSTVVHGIAPEGTWTHAAICRSGDDFRIFVNGREAAYRSGTGSVASSADFRIGARASGEGGLKGHISNFRVIKGKAIYTENFKPPMRELEATPETTLLACQSKTDASLEKTGKVITANGNAVASELTPGILTPVPKSGAGSAITGSVEFYGYIGGDEQASHLKIIDNEDLNMGTGEFTFEAWINPVEHNGTNSPNYMGFFSSADYGGSSGSITIQVKNDGKLRYIVNGGSGTPSDDETGSTVLWGSWHHVAIVRSGTTIKGYVNGVEEISSSYSTAVDFTQGGSTVIGELAVDNYYGDYPFKGLISNLRVVKGTALYTDNFIPPTRELKKVPGTVLLCCQDSNDPTQEVTGKTISLNGYFDINDVVSSGITTAPVSRNFTPQIGDDRKVTLEGVTKINTDAYFYLPTGDTVTRESRYGRILWAGGSDGGASPGFINLIQYANITTTGNALDFGDMVERATSAASSSSTRAVIFDGLTPSLINRIEKVEIASTGNATDYGDSTMSVFETASASNNTRGLNGGGYSSGSGTPANTETIEYITIASIGNALDFGDLTMGRRAAGALSSPIRACFAAGYQQPDASGTRTDRIDYVTIASTGNAIDFGNLTESGWGPAAMSNSVRGVYAGRLSPGSPGFETTIDYITIASTGNAFDFGDTTTGSGRGTGSSNKTRGVFILGNAAPSPNIQNHIDYITIATTGNAKDFGDLVSRTHQAGSTSDSHGGLG